MIKCVFFVEYYISCLILFLVVSSSENLVSLVRLFGLFLIESWSKGIVEFVKKFGSYCYLGEI